MFPLFIDRRPTGFKPLRGAEVDWTDPLARGLVACYLLNELDGNVYDIAKHDPRISGTLVNGASWVADRGIAMVAASSQHIDCVMADDTPFTATSGLTLICRCTINTGGNGTGNFRSFASKGAGNNSVNSPFDFRTDPATTPLMNYIRANAGGFKQYAGPAVLLGQRRNYGVTLTDNNLITVPTFWIDDASFAGSSIAGTGTGPVTGSGADLLIGARADFGGANQLNMDGTIESFMVWNRPLQPAEMTRLRGNPYAFIRASRSYWAFIVPHFTLTLNPPLPLESKATLREILPLVLESLANPWVLKLPLVLESLGESADEIQAILNIFRASASPIIAKLTILQRQVSDGSIQAQITIFDRANSITASLDIMTKPLPGDIQKPLAVVEIREGG